VQTATLWLLAWLVAVGRAAIVNDKTFGSLQCVPYAYGDFNADKLVDIYCLNDATGKIEIWVAVESMDPLFIRYKNATLNATRATNVVNIVPGDFNGDSIIDMLVVYDTETRGEFRMSLFLGRKQSRYENEITAEIPICSASGAPIVVVDQPFAAE
jgi:hypothetical protein